MPKRFTPADVQDFQRRLVLKIAENAAHKAFFQIPSRTLREAMEVEFVGTDGKETEARLHIPHYWAQWLHDGRGDVFPKQARVLVWFQKIEDDPRVAGGRRYPVTPEQVKKLSRSAYERGLRENARRKEAGLEPFMIVTTHAGPMREGKHFDWFETGMQGFSEEISPLVLREFDAWIRRFVPSETLPAVVRLR